jgi:hypothetical protein
MKKDIFLSPWKTPLVLFLAAMVGCGGGGGGSDGGGGSAAPTGVAAFGVVQGFGSIFVNGIEYETSGAAFSKDDSSDGIDQSHLRVGMMVTLHGSINDDGVTGIATSVDYRDNLEGPISSIDLATNSFVALGYTVIVDAGTIFDDALTFDQLAVGDFVEVSGAPEAEGNIRATFIDTTDVTCATLQEIEVKGTISNLNAGAQTFSIESLTVDYSIADLSDLTSGPVDGLFVEVKSNECPVGSTLVATRVETEDEFGQFGEGEEGGHVEIQGIVTSITSQTEFELSGQPIRITDQTQFVGLASNQIVLNLQLEVEGTLENGVLLAEVVLSEESPWGY